MYFHKFVQIPVYKANKYKFPLVLEKEFSTLLMKAKLISIVR